MLFRISGFTAVLPVVAAAMACGHQQAAKAETPEPVPANPPSVAPEPAKAAPAAPSDAPQPSGHMQAPMTAALAEPLAVPNAGTVDVVLHVTRVQPDLGPITIKVELPAGTVLAAGQAVEVVADKSATLFDRTFRVSYTSVPAADAKFVVDWQTPAAGFHAELPYRFGRAAPVAKEPPRLPGEVVLPGGQSLGRPILTNGGKKPNK